MTENFIRFRSPAKVIRTLGTWIYGRRRPSLVRCEVCKDVKVVQAGGVFECCDRPKEGIKG